jgi:hypothetical protein
MIAGQRGSLMVASLERKVTYSVKGDRVTRLVVKKKEALKGKVTKTRLLVSTVIECILENASTSHVILVDERDMPHVIMESHLSVIHVGLKAT